MDPVAELQQLGRLVEKWLALTTMAIAARLALWMALLWPVWIILPMMSRMSRFRWLKDDVASAMTPFGLVTLPFVADVTTTMAVVVKVTVTD